MILLQAPVPAEAIRDTVARIVTESGYRRSITTTLLSRFWDWFTRTLGDLFREATQSRGTYVVSLTLIALALGVWIARAVIVARARRHAASQRAQVVTALEQLAQARALAAQGAFVDAAHTLHAAIVTRLVEERRVRRHPSKTIGDYSRELRATSDTAAVPYRAFGQLYDIIAYGDGLCDEARFARLEALAAPLLSSSALAARAA